MKITWWSSRTFSTICGDIRNTRRNTCINDTGSKFANGAVSMTTVAHLDLRISPSNFRKIRKGPNEKKLKSKISWHCTFKHTSGAVAKLQFSWVKKFTPLAADLFPIIQCSFDQVVNTKYGPVRGRMVSVGSISVKTFLGRFISALK
jgi:hypothetical protein